MAINEGSALVSDGSCVVWDSGNYTYSSASTMAHAVK
jgi:hypothetical protein